MTKPLKTLCIFIAALIALTFFPVPASGAVEISGIYTSKLSVERNEKFDVYVKIPAMDEPASALNMRVDFDPNVFQVVSWSADIGLSDDDVTCDFNNTSGYFRIKSITTDDAIDMSRGYTFAAEMKARSTAPLGRNVLKLTDHSLTTVVTDGTSITNDDLWFPDTTETSVEIKTDTTTDSYPVKDGGIELSTSTLYRGSTFDVRIKIPALRTAETAAVLVEYDGNAFELVSWAPDIAGATANSGTSYFNLQTNSSGSYIDLTGGRTLTATLRVRDTATIKAYKFNLTQASFTFYDTSKLAYRELWTPKTTTATGTIYKSSGSGSGSSSFSPGNIVVTPENTTTTTTFTSPRITTLDPRFYDDEIEYSDSEETDTTIPAQEADYEESSAGMTEIDISGNDDDPVDDDDFSEDGGDPDDELFGPDEGDDPLEPDDDPTYIITNGSVSLDCSGLSGLTDSKVMVTTKNSFFPGVCKLVISNSLNANSSAEDALDELGMSGHAFYAFDISVLNTDTNSYVTKLVNGGTVEIQMPVPQNLAQDPESIEVFHIAGGRPVSLDREIVYDDGQVAVKFSADSFSPYMLADISGDAQSGEYIEIDDGSSGLISGKNSAHNGALNPNTGVAAAVIIPAALTGCVLLARKTVHRRKRAKSNIDVEDSE